MTQNILKMNPNEPLDTITSTAAKNNFGLLLHRVVYDHNPCVVQKNGTPMAVLVDLKRYKELLWAEIELKQTRKISEE